MYNSITLIGNLGADPETRQTPSGTSITSFRLATNHVYSQMVDGEREQVQQTEWYRVNCFGKTAEAVQQYLTQGRQVLVEGRHATTPYIANDGSARSGSEVYANVVKFLGGAPADGGQNGGGETPAAPGADEYGNPPDDAEYPENRRQTAQPHSGAPQTPPGGYGGQQGGNQPPRPAGNPGGYGGQQRGYDQPPAGYGQQRGPQAGDQPDLVNPLG